MVVENRLVCCFVNNVVSFVYIYVYIEKNVFSVVLIDKWNLVFFWICCIYILVEVCVNWKYLYWFWEI